MGNLGRVRYLVIVILFYFKFIEENIKEYFKDIEKRENFFNLIF